MSDVLDIGAVAKASGVPPSTLRYYEQKGLIRSCGRQGLRRLFPRSVLERLALIALGQNAGFSLEEITELLDFPDGIDRQRLLAQAEQIDRQIKALSAVRNGLRHVAACPSPNQFECPRFQRMLKISAKLRWPRQKAQRRPTKPN